MNLTLLCAGCVYIIIAVIIGILIHDNINVSSSDRSSFDEFIEGVISFFSGLFWPVTLLILLIGTLQAGKR